MRKTEIEMREVQVTGCGPYSCCLLTLIIEKVRRIPGVKLVRISVFPLSFLVKTLIITYDPDKTTFEQILDAIR